MPIKPRGHVVAAALLTWSFFPNVKSFCHARNICGGHNKCFWKSSETFLVRAARNNVARFSTDGQLGTQCCSHNVSSFCRTFTFYCPWSSSCAVMLCLVFASLVDTRFKESLSTTVLCARLSIVFIRAFRSQSAFAKHNFYQEPHREETKSRWEGFTRILHSPAKFRILRLPKVAARGLTRAMHCGWKRRCIGQRVWI